MIAAFANVAAATEAAAPPAGGGAPIHYLRALVPFTAEGLVAADERFGTNRHNPYFLPGALEKLGEQLETFDCRNVGQPVHPRAGGAAVRGRAEPRVPGAGDAVPAAQEAALTGASAVIWRNSSKRASISSRVRRWTRSVPNSSTLNDASTEP